MSRAGQVTLTRQQARLVDRIAMERFAVPGLVLMENAGAACARTAAKMLGEPQGRRVVVVCGPGNNGGDGYVVARHLSNAGAHVQIALVGTVQAVLERGGDAAVNLEIVRRMDLPVAEVTDGGALAGVLSPAPALVVDALLGTGVSGPLREPYLSAVGAINATRAPVLAVDVPSGLDCDGGVPLGDAVKARRTVTFVAPKVGLLRPQARAYVGELEVADIGCPLAAVKAAVEA